jgi:CBS domain-containing protein
MRVEDVMTKDVKTVGPGASLKDVAATLAELGISGLPVVENGNVVGVISEADILAKERGTEKRRGGLLGLLLDADFDASTKLEARTAAEAMTAPAITIGPSRSVTEAAATMIDERVNRLPVVDDDGKLVGIVSRADLVRAFTRSDDEIEREIREEVILRTLWIAPENISVRVESGEVTLAGHVETKVEAELVLHFVQRVPGVVSVVSDLSWNTETRDLSYRPPSWVERS